MLPTCGVNKIKKAQGISLNTIIIAALVLIVLIVLIVILSGRMNLFGDGYDSTTGDVDNAICMGDGYSCVTPDNGNCPSGRGSEKSSNVDWIDCTSNQICCGG